MVNVGEVAVVHVLVPGHGRGSRRVQVRFEPCYLHLFICHYRSPSLASVAVWLPLLP
jgi:hypothetical protein